MSELKDFIDGVELWRNKGKKGGRREKREIKNEKKEDRRAEIIKVWDRYMLLSETAQMGKGVEMGMRILSYLLLASTQSQGRKQQLCWWPQEARP